MSRRVILPKFSMILHSLVENAPTGATSCLGMRLLSQHELLSSDKNTALESKCVEDRADNSVENSFEDCIHANNIHYIILWQGGKEKLPTVKPSSTGTVLWLG